MTKYEQLTEMPVPRLICKMAWPAIISMLITSLYNVADTFFVGRLDTQSCAAVGVVFAYMTVMQAISFFFGHGSGNFISRALGARRTDDARSMASTGFFSALIFSTSIALCCLVFIDPVLRLMGSTPTVLPYAHGYFRWILIGTPFIVGCFVMNNQMRFQGNADMALIGILSGAILNIFIDPLFIFTLGLGVEGAGMATAISQMVSFFLLLTLSGHNGGIRLRLKEFAPSVARYREIVAGGLPSLFRQGLMAACAICLNNLASVYGDEALASFSIVSRVMHFATAIVLGFGQGYQPVCGFNYGAGLHDRVRRAFWFCVSVSTAYCMVICLLGQFFAPEIISLFRGEDPEVVRMGSLILRAQCASFVFVGFTVLNNMHFQTTRQTGAAILLAVARHGVFFFPVLFAGYALFGFAGLVAAHPIADFGAACCAAILRARKK